MAITSLTIYNDALSLTGSRRLATITDDVEEQRVITSVYDDCRDFVLAEHPWTFAQKRAALVNMTHPSVDLWVKATAYVVDDTVLYNDVVYNCLVANTSTIFTVDLAALEWEVKLTWVTATGYAIGDQVYESGINYTCLEAHTSGTFATDLTAVKWIISETLAMTEDGMTVIYYRPTDYIEVTMFSDRVATKVEGERILSTATGLKIQYTYSLDTPSLYSPQFRKCLAQYIAAKTCFALVGSATKAEALMEEYVKIVLPKTVSSDSKEGSPREVLADAWERARISGGSGIVGTTGDNVWHPIS